MNVCDVHKEATPTNRKIHDITLRFSCFFYQYYKEKNINYTTVKTTKIKEVQCYSLNKEIKKIKHYKLDEFPKNLHIAPSFDQIQTSINA